MVSVPAVGGQAAFRIGRTEVTNAQYRACVMARRCTVPRGTRSRYNNPAYANHPVVEVTRSQAREYAAWVGGSLPTEAQWTRACQANDWRTYPWGEAAPDATRANFSYNVGDTTAVGSYPAGASPYGALDMAGNVAEWVNDGNLVIRGGAFYYDADNVVCGTRIEPVHASAVNYVGVRVVSSWS
jgi:formylglycine-generating enzyme required for sulfatase activity